MAQHLSQDKLKEIRSLINTLQTEWKETLEGIEDARNQTKTEDLFANIEYLAFCDEILLGIYLDNKELDRHLKNLKDLKKNNQSNKSSLDTIDELLTEMQELKDEKEKKLTKLTDEYSVLAESTLRRSQDTISSFSDKMMQEHDPTLTTELRQNLDKELFVQELRDSLEAYREARENYIASMVGETQLPENYVPEDLGEEEPEIDYVLSELDTAITACDMALLNKEISE